MNKETQPTITVEDLIRRRSILAHQALGFTEALICIQPQIDLLTQMINDCAPIMTPAEESAAKERAMKAHADELAKGNAALAEAIDQVEKKNGKPPKETYGLTPGEEYTGRALGAIWGKYLEKKVGDARATAVLRYRRGPKRSYLYKAEDLIKWRKKREGK